MSFKVVRDNNRLPDLVGIIEELNRTEIHIGVFGSDDSHLLMIANVNEFGANIRPRNAKRLAVPLNKRARGKSPRQFNDLFPLRSQEGTLFLVRNKGANQLEFMYWLATEVNIPERAFIRGSFDSNKEAYAQRAARGLKSVLKGGMTLDSFFIFMGEYMVDGVRPYMTTLSDPPNSFATKGAKGSSNPLIDSGRLRQAITYRVVKV
ncbi:MAG: hypothetical protein FWC16_00765 [Defluviitaleaceae bacterium]|nr:hypothetical protein [Defluviitaleaceae bacterium]MCL2273436.1 hypothetical protein [Defluviitaleaceae bacterium]